MNRKLLEEKTTRELIKLFEERIEKEITLEEYEEAFKLFNHVNYNEPTKENKEILRTKLIEFITEGNK